MLQGRMDGGGDKERGVVGGTGGREHHRVDRAAEATRGRSGEGVRGTQLVMAFGGERRRGVKGGRHVVRRGNMEGGSNWE